MSDVIKRIIRAVRISDSDLESTIAAILSAREPVQSAPELIDQSREHKAYVYEKGLDFGAVQAERTLEARLDVDAIKSAVEVGRAMESEQAERTREAAQGMLETADKIDPIGKVFDDVHEAAGEPYVPRLNQERARPPGWSEHPADMKRAEPVGQRPVKPLSDDLAEWTAEMEKSR